MYNLHLDTSLEKARALHRVWRALNDGDCPKCHKHHPATAMDRETVDGICCPSCGFYVSDSEIEQIETMFAPAMDAAVAIFEEWRQTQVECTPRIEHVKKLAKDMKDAAWLMRFKDGIVQGSPFVGETIARQINQLLDAVLEQPATSLPTQLKEPTEQQIDSACTSYRHDFGLLDEGMKNNLRWEAQEFLRAWQKEGLV